MATVRDQIIDALITDMANDDLSWRAVDADAERRPRSYAAANIAANRLDRRVPRLDQRVVNHPTRINPILYNRPQYALTDIIGGVDVEVVAQHLDHARARFAENWDQLDTDPDDPR